MFFCIYTYICTSLCFGQRVGFWRVFCVREGLCNMATYDNRGEGLEGAITVLSYNTNGLGQYNKSRRVINKLIKHGKSQSPVIILLQETHFDAELVRQFNNRWRYNTSHAFFNRQSCGVTVLYFEHQWSKVIDNGAALDGRLAYSILLGHNDVTYNFISLYAPTCDNENVFVFIEQLEHFLSELQTKYPMARMVIGGDFNFTSNECDFTGRIVTAKEERIRVLYHDIFTHFDLFDSYRLVNNVGGYTWGYKNFNRGNNPLTRLDRVMVQNLCAVDVSHTSIQPEFDSSDHALLTIKFRTLELPELGPGIKRINFDFLDDDELFAEFKNDISKHIAESLNMNSQTRWEFIKCMIRSSAISINAKLRKARTFELECIETELNSLYLLRNDCNESNSCPTNLIEPSINRLRNSLNVLRDQEAERLKLYSGAKWTEEGEKCTSYFMNLVQRRKARSIVTCLDLGNSTIRGTKNVVEAAAQYYKDIYELKPSIPDSIIDQYLAETERHINKITNEQMLIFENPITLNELKTALNSVSNSAPGPDAIPYKVYKVLWDIIGEHLLASLTAGINDGLFSSEQRTSYITLIPKPGKDSSLIKNLRPINLSNTDIKILTKSYTNRFLTVLKHIIHPTQTGYVKGRQLQDNLNLIEYANYLAEKCNDGHYLVSLDAAKAFDSVSHKYIEKLLVKFGFGNYFVSVVNALYNNLKASIHLNGYLSDSILLKAGVKQGDSLSCILFILAVEPLIRSISNNTTIKGLQITSPFTMLSEEIQTVSYADDINSLVKDVESIQNIFNEYGKFSLASGIFLNHDKTEVVLIGNLSSDAILNTRFQYLDKHINIQISPFVKIGGIFFPTNKPESYNANITNKINKMRAQLQLWQNRTLSLFGKSLIFKAFGLSQIIFSLQTCSIKKNDLTEITRLMFKFIWNGRDKIKRNFLYLNVNEGGIAAPNIEMLCSSLAISRFIRNMNTTHPVNVLFDRILFKHNFKSSVIHLSELSAIKNVTAGNLQAALSAFNNIYKHNLESLDETVIQLPEKIGFVYILLNLSISNSPQILNHPMSRTISTRLMRMGINTLGKLIIANDNAPQPDLYLSMAIDSFPRKYINIARHYSDLTNSGKALDFCNVQGDLLNFSKGSTRLFRHCLLRIHLNTSPCLDSNWLWDKHHIRDPQQPVLSWDSKIINSPYFRGLHFKILHKAFVSKYRLMQFGIISNDEAICNWCQEEYDDLEHSLLSCPGSISTWENFRVFIQQLGYTQNLNNSQIKFGLSEHNKFSYVLNNILVRIKHQLINTKQSFRFCTPQDFRNILLNLWKIDKLRLRQQKAKLTKLWAHINDPEIVNYFNSFETND